MTRVFTFLVTKSALRFTPSALAFWPSFHARSRTPLFCSEVSDYPIQSGREAQIGSNTVVVGV